MVNNKVITVWKSQAKNGFEICGNAQTRPYQGGKKQVNDFLRLVIGKSRYGDPTEKDMTTPQIDKMLNKGMKGKNEMKEGRDLSEFTSLDEGNNIPKIKDIVAKKQAQKIQGVMVDMFTASLISQIYDKVNDANKKKMEKMTVC